MSTQLVWWHQSLCLLSFIDVRASQSETVQLQGRGSPVPFWFGCDCDNRRKYFHRFLAGMLDCDAGCSRLTYLAPRGTGSCRNLSARRVPHGACLIHRDERMSRIVPPDEEADVHISRYGVISDFR